MPLEVRATLQLMRTELFHTEGEKMYYLTIAGQVISEPMHLSLIIQTWGSIARLESHGIILKGVKDEEEICA